MKSKLSGLFGALLLLLSITGSAVGTVALGIHALTFEPYGAATPAPDKIVITGTESHTWTNPGSETNPTIYLPHGSYDVSVQKAGYTAWELKGVEINDDWGAQRVLIYDLTATSTGGTGGTGDGGVEPQPGTTSTDVYVKDISFDEDAKPAQNVEFEFEVKNVAGYEAEDVEATLIVVGLDDGDDVEVEDIRVGDVEKDDTADDIKAVLTVPVKADEGKYTVKVHLTWEDRDGKEYRNLDFVATDKLNIERAEHDVQITKLRLSAETLQPGTEGEIGITLMNIGENDEKVKVRVQSEKLGISETSAEFKVEEGDEVTQYIPFTVSEDAEDGKYFIYVTATFNNGADEMLQFTTVDIRAAGPVTGAAPVTVTPTVTTTGDEKAGWTAKGLLIAVVVLIGVAAVLAKEYAPKRPVVISTSRRGRR